MITRLPQDKNYLTTSVKNTQRNTQYLALAKCSVLKCDIMLCTFIDDLGKKFRSQNSKSQFRTLLVFQSFCGQKVAVGSFLLSATVYTVLWHGYSCVTVDKVMYGLLVYFFPPCKALSVFTPVLLFFILKVTGFSYYWLPNYPLMGLFFEQVYL